MKESLRQNLSARVILALAVIGLGVILAACANNPSTSNHIVGALATPTVDRGPAETATAVERSIQEMVAATVVELKIQIAVAATVRAARTATAEAQPSATPTATSTPTRLPGGQAATPTSFPPAPVRAQDLGICINPWIEGHAPSLAELEELGVGWVRFVAYESKLDQLGDVLAQYKGVGLRIILVVNQETFPQKEDSPWLYVERFSGLFEGLVRSHSNLVDAWEIWNEPEDKARWKHLDEASYVHLLELCYEKAKAVDSETVVLASGYLDFLRLKGVPRDGGAFHPYGQQINGFPSNYVRYYESLRVLYLHADVPLWLTEFGASLESLQGLGVEPEEAQAEYLKRVVEEVRRLGPEVVKVAAYFCWTDLDNHEQKKLYGLVDKDGSRRKAYYVLAQLARE